METPIVTYVLGAGALAVAVMGYFLAVRLFKGRGVAVEKENPPQ